MLDEPLGALDRALRERLVGELRALFAPRDRSILLVTHDHEEAFALADRVVVLTAGPATIKGIYSVDLPRPRNVAEVRFDPRFADIYQEIWADLREEVLVSYERNKRNAAA